MGEEAIAYALHTSFDLILLDLCLPRVDGIRMIKELRSSPMAQLTPTIVVSAARRTHARCVARCRCGSRSQETLPPARAAGNRPVIPRPGP